MIELYVKTGCPYCAKVLEKLNDLGIPFKEKNIFDSEVAAELISIGGKRQVPFMNDDNMTPYIVDDDVEMYESNDIIEYLDKKFGKSTSANQKIDPENIHLHRDDGSDVCGSCQ